MRKGILLLIAILSIGSFFLYNLYQTQMVKMEHSFEHIMHRH